MKILIVDDSRSMRMLVRRALRRIGFEVDVREAEDGHAALASLSDFSPAVILSDWNMPNMTGLELVTALRKAGWTVPFGLITSEGTAEKRVAAQEAGASFLLQKPFSEQNLESALMKEGIRP